MAKFEKIWYVCVSIAAAGIVGFWIAGFTGHLAVSTACFLASSEVLAMLIRIV